MLDEQEFKDLESKLRELKISYKTWDKVVGNRVILV
jgi:hypothetical protein